MLKKLLCLILIIMSVFALAACSDIFGQGGSEPDNGGGGNEQGNNKPDYSKLVYNRIVYSDESLRKDTTDSDKFSLDDLRLLMLDVTSPVSISNTADSAAVAGEIVFGDTDRDITAKAKAKLEAELAKSSKYDTGYIIYVEAPYVAVYWMHKDMAQLAMTTFINKCVDEGKLIFAEGIAHTELYSKREFELDKYWIALEATGLDENIITSLRNIFDYFDGTKLAGWCANLYDPAIEGDDSMGGFYYSRSARDTAGYLPDIESTSQLLGLLVSNKAFINYGNSRDKAIPDHIKRQIVAFAQDMQSAEDGYFYHRQWAQGRENLNTDRYGRDLGNATGVITSFSFDTDGDGVAETQRPLWCAPNGTKCALHYGTKESCTFSKSVSYYTSEFETNVTTSLVSSVSSSVAKVTESNVTSVVSQHPDYSSRAAFSAWLEEYNKNIKTNSGNAHNLAAIQSEITAHGYIDVVLDHLDRVQAELFEEQTKAGIEPTGLWQTDINYRLVWGMLKYATFYNHSTLGRAINPKYIPYIVKSCAKVTALPPDGNYYMNDIYNQWTSIQGLVNNVSKYNPDYLDTIYELVRENASVLIDNTLSKMEPMAMTDGSISYHSSGISMTTIYGTSICMGVREGDVNAVALATGLYGAIYTCLGYKSYMVPIFSPDDGELFISELLASQPIDKATVSTSTYDFEDGTISNTITFTSTTGATLEVADDPTGEVNKTIYLATGSSTTSGDTIAFKPASHGSSCYIFETDIYVDSKTDSNYLFQCDIGNKYMIAIFKSGNNVIIKDMPSKSHQNYGQTLATFPVDEWHKLRVEFYAAGESTNELEKPAAKIWIDGELQTFTNLDGQKVTYSQNYFGSDTNASVVSNYSKVTLYAMKVPKIYMYFDNCFVSSDDKVFDAEDDAVSDYRDNL